MKTKTLLTTLLISSSIFSEAANLRFIWSGLGAGNEFTTAGNWGGEAPGSTQTTGMVPATLPGDILDTPGDATNIIMQISGGLTTHTSAYTFPNIADVLIIRNSHRMDVSADLNTAGTAALLGQTGSGNIFNHTAGVFTAGAVTVGGSSSDADINISGTADFNATSLNINAGSTFDIILGSTGISPINITGAVTNSGIITVDTSNYDFNTNGSQLTLFNAASSSLGTINITGPGEASVDAGGNIIISNIPEPTSSSLIGLALLGLIAKRKR